MTAQLAHDMTRTDSMRMSRPSTRGEIIKFNTQKRSEFECASHSKKTDALHWETVVLAIRRIRGSRSNNWAVQMFLGKADLGDLEPYVDNALRACAVGKKALPSRSTIFEKLAAYDEKGLDGLIKEHKGRVRQDMGWEALALELYSQPSKPDVSAVHRKLTNVHGCKCSYDQVLNYLRSLPATMGRMSPARIGRELYRQTQASYIQRCTDNLMAGDIFMADGYRADVYLAHPVTGDIWRPEIMHVIDLKSRYLVGYRIMMHEGSFDVMIGWAEMFERWAHVPPLLYVDNGSGYKNRFTEDETSSYYHRAGVQQVIHSIPHNPKGKGHIERYHRSVKDRFLKLWHPEFYCGTDMAAEVLQKTVRECKAGRMVPPSLVEFVEAYNTWIIEYNNDVHPENKHVTKASLWAELEPIAPHASAREIARPSESRKVSKARVALNNRHYGHPDLHQWNGHDVLVEVDVFTDQHADIRTLKGELICTADLLKRIGNVTDSFMEDKRNSARVAALGRLEKKVLEQKARAGRLIDADAVSEAASTLLEGEYRLLDSTENNDAITLDLTIE